MAQQAHIARLDEIRSFLLKGNVKTDEGCGLCRKYGDLF